MARSEPGSLAARSDLKNKLTFFRRKSRRKASQAESVGEVTIEIEDDSKSGLPAPSKASPSVDCESGPSSTSPTLTMSPMSSPIAQGSTTSHSPHTQAGDGSYRHSPQSQTKTDEANSTISIKTEETKPDPMPRFDPENANQRSLVAIATTSDPGTIPTPSPKPKVVMRKPRSSPQSSDSLKFQREKFKRYSISRFQARNSNNEAGKLLKLALDRHFDEKLDVAAQFAPDLDNYVSEVFLQLDYHHCGTISKEDFETLCEVLQITISPPASYRNSGIEWLSSYRPRANSPISPIRVDKLSEVKYSHSNGKKSNLPAEPSPNFLFTIGPRPFWELWPQKKRKKKRFTIDEFKKCLLEQWAKSMGYPLSKVSSALPVSPSHSSQEKPPSPSSSSSPDAIETIEDRNGHHVNGGSQVHHHMNLNETRTRRLMRSVVRVTKRYQMLDKISKRLQRQWSDEHVTDQKAPMANGVNGMSQNNNIQAKPCPVHQTSSPSSPTVIDRSRTNGTRHNPNRQGSTLAPSTVSHGTSCSSHCYTNGVALQRVKSRQSWRNSRSGGGARVVNLEKQVLHQQEEIRTLRDVIEDLRSSLQLSDAQNLALQVLLRKMAKAEIQLPLASDDTFRSQMNESEKQLENLVKELKEMSQIRYPRLSTSNKISPVAHNTGTGTSSSGSVNPESFLLEDELDQTSQALGGAQNELKAAQQELRHTAIRLQEKESELKDNSMDLNDAYKALEKAQQELNKMRLELEEAQVQVEVTKHEMCETQEELLLTRCQVRNSDAQLRDTEKRLSQLNQNRMKLMTTTRATMFKDPDSQAANVRSSCIVLQIKPIQKAICAATKTMKNWST
ncbi:hypothetical protein TCAL_15041 [Tigriopus californicus]|uniref:EF-hand domain-containing protein n=1 Tax=Tigriopus californicus TaxID=6832 RepID=A0A553NYK4_TIGCA|nr:hypothetical protein TCAL_15041 [Tigriopus californicus]